MASTHPNTPAVTLRRSFWLFVASQVVSSAFAQPFQWQARPSFQVLHGAQPLPNPFTGGINAPIMQFVDIDGDGDVDLFLLDIDGRLNYYENAGSRTAATFVLKELSFQSVRVGSWYRFVNIDADGDYDLFCSRPSATVNFYRNTGTRSQPLFVLEVQGLKDSNGNPILSETISIPAFADMDGDGDFDFFSGNSVGTIWYYENIGTAANFIFRFVTQKYQGIEIVGVSGKAADQYGIGPKPSYKEALHGAMAITFADIDGDGDIDLFWGDFFNRSLYLIENRGTRTSPQLVLRDSTYPKPNSVLTDGFNMPQLVDIDGDSDLDLFVGVLFGTTTIDNFRFYRNSGSPAAPNFQLEILNLIQTLDVGAASSPIFVDLDGDGDRDLLIGSEDGKLLRYNREGSGATLRFVINAAPLVSVSGFFNISPAVGDIDGDGKPDLVVGEANGRLHLFRGSDLAVEDTTFALRSVSFGQNASPVLVDFDGDALLDLFVGTGGGRISYYRNAGTSPQFVLQTNFFQSIDVGDDAKPLFVDLDHNGTLDLVVGSRDSSLSFWRNSGGVFTRVAGFFQDIPSFPRTAPAFDDVEGDGDLDLFLGNYKGGLFFYRNKKDSSDAGGPVRTELYQNFPNPFSSRTSIHYQLLIESKVRLSVFDLLGREVAVLVDQRQDAGEYSVVFNAKNYSLLPSGVYFYRLKVNQQIRVKTMLLVK